MADQFKESGQSWVASEDEVWAALRKRQQRKRDFLWLLVGLLLLLIGNLTGFPGQFFT